jgi:hypothetical protein
MMKAARSMWGWTAPSSLALLRNCVIEIEAVPGCCHLGTDWAGAVDSGRCHLYCSLDD